MDGFSFLFSLRLDGVHQESSSQPDTFQSYACTLGQHRTAGNVTEVAGDALGLRREAFCKLIPDVCDQSTKSLVFQVVIVF